MRIVVILFFLFLYGCTSGKAEGIKSRVSVIRRVDPSEIYAEKGRFYSIKIDLVNETDSTLIFWTMSCSWQVNWITEDKTQCFFIYCAKNTPEKIQLKSNQKLTYKGIIELKDSTKITREKNLKLGFVLIRENEVRGDGEFFNVLYKKIDIGKEIFWSEPFEINK